MKHQEFAFGRHSQEQLAGVDDRLVRVCKRALSYGLIDFRVDSGARTDEEQAELYAQGRTKPGTIVTNAKPGQSKHGVGPLSGRDKSHAVDLIPVAPVNWEDRERFAMLAGIMFVAAREEGVDIRWGGDWDGDGQTRDERFRDSPHFELVV